MGYLSLQEEDQMGRMREWRIVQGVEMGRRSEIGVRVEVESGRVKEIELRGTAVRVSEGAIVV
jgi:predicted PhzF superfamily epimerase YddE/YHI9